MSIEIECQYCGSIVYADRISRKYCSDSCKTMACRKRRVDERILSKVKAMGEKTLREIKGDEKQLKLIQEQQAEVIAASERKQQERIDALFEGIKETIHPKGEKKVRSAEKDKTTTDNEMKSSARRRKIRKRGREIEKQNEPTVLSALFSGFNKAMDSFKKSK